MVSIVVEDRNEDEEASDAQSELVTWVTAHVDDWVNYRDTNFKDSWNEYYRLWRGIWASEDKTTQSERSRLISPALQQAIEMGVAEIEEATFGKGKWFDVADDVLDENKEDMTVFRTLLAEDMKTDGVEGSMSEVFLNAALYGTGIGKIVVEEQTIFTVGSESVNNTSVQQGIGEEGSRISSSLVAVPNDEFCIDTTAKTIDEALGMAHIMDVPLHSVQAKQESGVYYNIELGGYPDDVDVSQKGESKTTDVEDKVRITEYHGLVPRHMLDIDLEDDEELVDLEIDEDDEDLFKDEELVEAIVTIANGGVLLRAVENPNMMKDRAFIAFQYDTIPNRFWGRGVAEKGFNMQKAIDAELRARMDAMALTVHPMIAADATRLPRGFNLSVQAGRQLLTNGDPNQILMPFKFGSVGSETFTQSGDLERQLQNATGSMDAASPISMNSRNSTASGMSMIQGGAVKRSKRTMANIERNFISPLVHKNAWRRIQFDSDRYNVVDVKFTVYGSLGIMAREIEQQQLSSLLNTVPPDSPAYWMLIRSIYENSSITSKDKMIVMVDQLLEKTLNPQPDPMVELEKQKLQVLAKDKSISLQIEHMRATTERQRVINDTAKLPYDQAKSEADAMLSVAKAESEEIGSQLGEYRAIFDALKVNADIGNKENGDTNTDPLQQPAGNVPTGGVASV